jgi:hypothetical protein
MVPVLSPKIAGNFLCWPVTALGLGFYKDVLGISPADAGDKKQA